MRVLVVGGTGFIGTTLCRELNDRGHDVTALARNPPDSQIASDITLRQGDVTDPASLADAFADQDAVINLVSLSPLYKPRGGDERHFAVTRDGTANVVEMAEQHDVEKFVQISALGADPDGTTAFIQAKGQAEEIIRDSSLPWVIIRPSVVFGEGGEFISFTKTLAPPYVTPLPDGGTTRFQPIWVGDFVPMLADAIVGVPPDEAGGRESRPDGDDISSESPTVENGGMDDPYTNSIYEIGGPDVLTLADVATLAHAADGRSTTVLPLPMSVTKLGLTVIDVIPGIPLGTDQYYSLQFDNTTASNDVSAFGRSEADLLSLADYLDVDPELVEG